MIINLPDKVQIQGLILIDCWETQVPDHLYKDKWYINLSERLLDNNFKWIVNSLTGLRYKSKHPCIASTQKVSNYDDNHPLLKDLKITQGKNEFSNILQKYLVANCNTVIISNIERFEWFLKDHLKMSINHWLVVGQTWQMCTHETGLGLPQLARLSGRLDVHFYATDYSFLKLTGDTANSDDFNQDWVKWAKVENFGYKLLPYPYS